MPRILRSLLAWIASVTIAVGMAACGTGPNVDTGEPAATVHVAATPPPVPGSGSCTNRSRTHDAKHGIEVRGTTTDHQPLTVLFARVHHTIPASKSLTTYVRVGGVRALRISLIDAAGHVARAPGFRPGLPPFDLPGGGTPWTGSITFPKAGCWRVYVQRAGLTGELWLHAG
jgi:hypothetical protein